jgi:hypothetical protein
MPEGEPSRAEVLRVLRFAAVFGLLSGTVWALGFGWRGALLGVVGAAAVVGMYVLTRLFSLRVALLVATLTMFLVLMLVVPSTLSD